MQKNIFTLAVSLSTLLLSTPALAQSSSSKANKQDNLTQTEQRLTDLIKAAAAQNLLEVRRSEPGTPTTRLTAIPPIDADQPNMMCSSEDVFTFPPETHAEHYEDILALKSAMVTGPEQIDTPKAQILAQSYLGLGFTDEAINIAEHLAPAEQSAITAMAHLVSGTMDGTHRKTLQLNAACFGAAQIWQKLAQPEYAVWTDTDRAYLNELPARLRAILGLQLAMKALQSRDMNTTQLIYDDITANVENHAGYNPELSPYLQNDAVGLLGALLALEKHGDHERRTGIARLKSIAERDGPYRAQALQALVNTDHLYPEYKQDLDSVSQTFSETPSGKQAQAQKISLLADEYKFEHAVTAAKDSFVPESSYYAQSVIVISLKMQSALMGTNANHQLGALNTLLTEGDFFAHLSEAKPLRHAGVNACIKLGLTELAPEVLPVQYWGELDDSTLVILALQSDKLDNFHAPKHIYKAPVFRAAELRTAFDDKNTRQAFAILNTHPNSTALQTTFTQGAWDNGYWSLAQNSLRKNSGGRSGNDLNLATTLSVISPTLIKTHRPSGLTDQLALQSYLEGDLKIIRTYLLPNLETLSGPKSGTKSGSKSGSKSGPETGMKNG